METYIYIGRGKNETSCLNRTMQYGNLKEKKEKKTNISEFKSYYVVWKQYFVDENKYIPGGSLNRTMQYGNRLQHF